MKNFRLVLLIFTILLLSHGVSHAQQNLTDVEPGNSLLIEEPSDPVEATNEIIEVGSLRFYTSQTEFNDICGEDLSFEDFEDTNVPPNSIRSCPEPLNTFSDDLCFLPGQLIPGFSMTVRNATAPGQEFVALTPNFNGVTNVTVGANTFIADNIISFTEPVDAAGMVLVGLLAGGGGADIDVNVLVFGPGNVFLGSTTVDVNGLAGTFIGVESLGSLIERIELVEVIPGINTIEALYELSFGTCPEIVRAIPTLSEWGMIAMAGVIGIAGVLFVVRRRNKVTI